MKRIKSFTLNTPFGNTRTLNVYKGRNGISLSLKLECGLGASIDDLNLSDNVIAALKLYASTESWDLFIGELPKGLLRK